jgi:CheY-like chemotaxis protein
MNRADAHHGAGRLLAIDDEEGLLACVREIGMIAGYEVEATTSPATFLRLVREWRPTLIFLDLAMPDSDGVELLHALAAYKFTAPIVLMSGCDAKVLRTIGELGTDLGLTMRGALAKPVRLDAFRVALELHALGDK